MKRIGLVDGRLTGTRKKADKVMGFHPPAFSCKSEGKLGVWAGVGEAGAGQDKQSERRELMMDNLMEKGKRARKAAVIFALLMNCKSVVTEYDGGTPDGHQREK